MTTGPPISSAAFLASSADVAKANFVVGMPARRTTSRDSYSKKRIEARTLPAPVFDQRQAYRLLEVRLAVLRPALALVEAPRAGLLGGREEPRQAAGHERDGLGVQGAGDAGAPEGLGHEQVPQVEIRDRAVGGRPLARDDGDVA